MPTAAGQTLQAPPDRPTPIGRAPGHYRWVICGLIFLATSISYIDRQVIGILKPTLQQELGWSEIDYANIVFAFTTAYAFGQLLVGRVIDRLGTKLSYALALTLWSLAAMSHAAVRSVAGFTLVRIALGLGEAANFPAAIKSVAEWFPRHERALATGLFNSGSNVGATVAPIVVPWLTMRYGWQAAFLVTGAIGVFWIFLWWPLFDRPETHARLTAGELAYIRSEPEEPAGRVPWREVVGHRQLWAFALAKMLTDPIWWLYLFWIPDFLNRNHGIDLQHVGLPLVVIYLVADVGSIGGGWLSSTLLRRGWSVNAGRKTAMLVCALAVVPVTFASRVHDLWLAVALVAVASAAHQGWSANVYTMASDMFPRRALGTVVGIGGMAGMVGSMGISALTGIVLQATGSYVVVFAMAGSAYLLALCLVQVLTPSMRPARIGSASSAS